MIIFVKGGNQALDFMLDRMAEGAKEPVYELDLTNGVNVVSFLSQHFWEINEKTIVMTINQLSFDMELRDFWEIKKVRLFNLIVDHPVYYAYENLSKSPAQTCHLVIDKNHANFMHRYFPQFRTEFLPHGGTIWKDEYLKQTEKECGRTGMEVCRNTFELSGMLGQVCKKPIDILYVGHNHLIGQKFHRDCLCGKDEDFMDYGIEQYLHNPYVVADQLVDDFAGLHGLYLSEEERMQLIYDSLWFAGRKVSDMVKLNMIRMLSEAGCRVTVFGGGWDSARFSKNVELHKPVSAADCIRLIARAKCVLNFSPYYDEGGHERVFNAMLNHSICVTNKGHYLERRFAHKEDLIYINFENPEETVHNVKEVLADEDKFKKITDAAFSKVQKDTWADRFREICEITCQ